MEVVWKCLTRPAAQLMKYPSRCVYHEFDRYKRIDNISTTRGGEFDTSIAKSNAELQFSQSMLNREGGLKRGDIPEPLKYTRPYKMATLENGIRVCTEYWPAKAAAVGVIIGAGSRHETLETSGTAHFMEHLHFKV